MSKTVLTSWKGLETIGALSAVPKKGAHAQRLLLPHTDWFWFFVALCGSPVTCLETSDEPSGSPRGAEKCRGKINVGPSLKQENLSPGVFCWEHRGTGTFQLPVSASSCDSQCFGISSSLTLGIKSPVQVLPGQGNSGSFQDPNKPPVHK